MTKCHRIGRHSLRFKKIANTVIKLLQEFKINKLFINT